MKDHKYPLPDIRHIVRAWLEKKEIDDIAELFGVPSPRGKYDIMIGKVTNNKVRDAWLSRVEARQQALRRATATPDELNRQLAAEIKEYNLEPIVWELIKRMKHERENKSTTAAA